MTADNYAERIETLVKERDTRQRDAEYWKTRYDGAITLERKRNAETEAELARVREALSKACNYLREVGDDYPGSGCHRWCHEKADECTALAGKSEGEK